MFQEEQHQDNGNSSVEEKTMVTGNGVGNEWIGSSSDFNQQQQFECFNCDGGQLLSLIDYIEKLVYCANCSTSAFIVMLLYVDRVQK